MRKLTMLSRFTRPSLGLSLAAAALLTVAGPAAVQATPVQFASFTTATGTPFTFTNQTTFASLGGSPNTVNFTFASDTGLSQLTYTANVIFTGTTNAKVNTFGAAFDQAINGPVNAITFTDVNSGKTLLSVQYTGDITGQLGTSNASLSSSSNIDRLVYSSQFLSSNFFNNPSNFLLALPTDGSSDLSVGAGGFLNSFSSSSATGQFFTTLPAAVPQPASVAMFGTGLGAIALLAVRKNRGRRAAPALAV